MDWKARVREERGATLVIVAGSMIFLLGMAALAVDVGQLYLARTEAQRTADGASLAGAAILAVSPESEDAARDEAQLFAAQNPVIGQVVNVADEDVIVDLAQQRVTVIVRRTAANGNPINNFFARILGINTSDVTALATAEAAIAGPESGADCILPVMLPDRWDEGGGRWPTASDSFDPDDPEDDKDEDKDDGIFDTFSACSENPDNCSGYSEDVIGTQISIHKVGGGGGGLNPSWYYPWAPWDDEDQLVDGGPGAALYEDRFTGCLQSTYLPGDSVKTEPGAMPVSTARGFQALIDSDPDVYWNPDPDNNPSTNDGCPWNPTKLGPDGSPGACDFATSRIRPIPMFDPRFEPQPGRKWVYITNFAQVFIEGLTQQGANSSYTGRFLGYITPEPDLDDDGGGSEGPNAGEPVVKILRLVE